MDEKYVLNWPIFNKRFSTYFYRKILIDYDYSMKNLKTHWYILVLYPFKSIKNPITILFSFYFHVLETKVGHIFAFLKMYLNGY
jgi:hypothetical protein